MRWQSSLDDVREDLQEVEGICSLHKTLPAGRDCDLSGVSSRQSCVGCRRAQVRVLLPALRVIEQDNRACCCQTAVASQPGCVCK